MTELAAIDDLDDPRVANYRDSRDADLRGRCGLFLVESEVCIRRWLEGVKRRRLGERLPPSLDVHSLLLARRVHDALAASIEAAGVKEVLVGEMALIERISGFDHHHGALGLGRRPGDDPACIAALLELNGPIVVTDGVVHVDNMGSIFRNAAALQAAGVLLSARCADPLTRKAIRISMGHVFGVPWATSTDLPQMLRMLRARGWRVLVAENAMNAIDIDDLEGARSDRDPGADGHDARVAIVFGAEGHGVSPAVLAAADAVVRIPSREGVPLNVAVASAIVLHELGRAERKRAARRL